jgi:hypothetical protein
MENQRTNGNFYFGNDVSNVSIINVIIPNYSYSFNFLVASYLLDFLLMSTQIPSLNAPFNLIINDGNIRNVVNDTKMSIGSLIFDFPVPTKTIVRYIEKTDEKIANKTNSLVFNETCLREEILPTYTKYD